MLRDVFCECGRLVSYQPGDAGTSLRCECGSHVDIPYTDDFGEDSAHEFREVASSAEFCPSCKTWVTPVQPSSGSDDDILELFAIVTPVCPHCFRTTLRERPNSLFTLRKALPVLGIVIAAIFGFLSFSNDADEANAKLEAARELATAGEKAAALELYDNLISEYTELPHLYYERALLRQDIGQHAKAIDDFTMALNLNVSGALASLNANALHQRGHCNVALGQSDLAGQDFTASLMLEHNNVEFLTCRGQYYWFQKEQAKAIIDLRQALELDPQNTRAVLLLGNAYRQTNRVDEAIDLLAAAIEASQSFPEAHLERAYCLMQEDQPALAIKDFKIYIETFPDDPEALQEQGRCYLIIEQFAEAVDCLDAAIDLRDTPVARYLRAAALASQGNFEHAQQDLQNAMSVLPATDSVYEECVELKKSIEELSKQSTPASPPITT